jgi:7-cyano-7-deazaguanine reductase
MCKEPGMSDGVASTDADGHGDLTLLGRSIRSPVFAMLRAAAEGQEGPTLETVPAPPGLVEASAMIECLVSWCPVTHQIDYYLPPAPGRGGVEIRYAPQGKLVESKSLKLYGEWFLTKAMFAEALAVEIAQDIYRVTDAHWVRVQVYQATRGGIRLGGEALLPVSISTAPARAGNDEEPSKAQPGGR